MFLFPEVKGRTTKKRASQSMEQKHKELEDPLRVDEPEFSNYECDDIHENLKEPALEGKTSQ